MKFFVPDTSNVEEAEQVYEGIRRHVQENGTGAQVKDRRIFRLRYIDQQKEFVAEVGRPTLLNGEIVIAIFQVSTGLYYVCTPNRGVLRGDPIYVGQTTWTEDFES